MVFHVKTNHTDMLRLITGSMGGQLSDSWAAMLQDLYSELDEVDLAAAFLAATNDIRLDPRERKRGLPPVISSHLFADLRQMVGASQKDAERVFLKAEAEASGGAEGRQARRYECGETSMSIDSARDALAGAAWGSALNEHPEWMQRIQMWWIRLDLMEAAQETLKTVRRRGDPSEPDAAVDVFRQQLLDIARRAERIGYASLMQKFGTNLSHFGC